MEGHGDGDTMIMEVTKSYIKGKRTKRRRPSPALTLTLASATSSSTSSEITSPANHQSTIEFTNNILQDDQDIANCLMLLAHGHHNMAVAAVQPRSSVYECKTCDRGFTSFQALGGHRASHNKPPTPLEKNRNCEPNKTLSSCNYPSGSTKGSLARVHECSICGSEFTSGQALGGHMRRHRSMTMATTRTPTTCDNTSNESKKHKTAPLDLNLPAPIEDDHKETGISFGSNNQIIVFTRPAGLVDCHF
ncbi:hypothetical protein SSX86_001021 [Deinandra increscens subsp. villosa]|uniref:C2H2-type domain-containing protein n=1 Tax=Deinandra increscens subsp. villosa TaxID=3103831 RepID=A0AAP0HE47_9ASTR